MAQLGARFHGMEEVVSSNLTRSTKSFNKLVHLPVPAFPHNSRTILRQPPRSRSTLPHLRPDNSEMRIPVETSVATINWITGGSALIKATICSSVSPYFLRLVFFGPRDVCNAGFFPDQ